MYKASVIVLNCVHEYELAQWNNGIYRPPACKILFGQDG